MERTQAIAIEHTQAIEDFLREHENNFDISVGFCPEFGKKAIWIYPSDFPLDILALSPIVIVNPYAQALILFRDTGTEEAIVRNNEYQAYTLAELYKKPTGKYAPPE